jgi:hypothetical protein
MPRGIQVVFNCRDPDTLAAFGASALGYEKPPPPDGYDTWQSWAREQGMPENVASAIEDPDELRPRLHFQRVRRQRWPRTASTWTSTSAEHPRRPPPVSGR